MVEWNKKIYWRKMWMCAVVAWKSWEKARRSSIRTLCVTTDIENLHFQNRSHKSYRSSHLVQFPGFLKKWYITVFITFRYSIPSESPESSLLPHNKLTHSVEQSPPWDAEWSSGCQEIPRILWNPKVHYHTRKRQPLAPVLKILFNITVPSTTCVFQVVSFPQAFP
jgi:hypothetical protein